MLASQEFRSSIRSRRASVWVVCTSSRSPQVLPRDFKAPPRVLRAATAAPPYCTASSLSMSLCAPALSPISTMLRIRSFCSLVNLVPLRLSASSPVCGSSSALPSWMTALCRSIPSAEERFSAAPVACSNASPAMERKLSSTDWASRISSSPNVVICWNCAAISARWPAE